MQALILAGGEGTRLRPLTLTTPKPIISLGNRPFLLSQIELLKRCGITDITLSLNYQPYKISHLLGDGSHYGVNLRYLVEPQPMGTAGAYKYAADYLRESTVVFNGDILTDIDLNLVMQEHRRRSALATIVLTRVSDPAMYGLVETSLERQVLRFLEKPDPDVIARLKLDTVNAGIYILEPLVLDLIAEGRNCSFEYDVFPVLLKEQLRFFAFIPENAYWIDIGVPERYLQAHFDLMAGKVAHFTKPPVNDYCLAAWKGQIDTASWLAEDCVVKPGARIVNSVLGQGVLISENARIENSVILPGVQVKANTRINRSIIGQGCRIGSCVSLHSNTVLGDNTTLTDYTSIWQ